MGEERGDGEDEIRDILSDMDAILSGMPLPSAPETASKPPQEPPAAVAPAPQPPPAPLPAPAPAPVSGLKAPDPIPDVPVPEKMGKEQIRRVAFVYLERYAQERDAFGKTLEQAANTIAKKPLFLRTVLFQVVSQENSPAEALARVRETQAVAVLALFEGMPEAKIKEYGDVFGATDIMFRVVAPGDAQKRSVAVDLVVDMMLLGHEA